MLKQLSLLVVVLISLSLPGCSSTQKAQKAPATPDLTVQVASLNLSNLNRRLEKKDIAQFSKIIRREQIEILAVQNITRYPGLETRIDFVKELSSQADLRNVFGEMINNSGKQTGNAVFSSYPIRSNYNRNFEGIRSTQFESALIAVIDGGIRDIAIISTLLPSGASADDQSSCLKILAAMNSSENKLPTILAGNLPVSEVARGSFQETLSSDVQAKKIPTAVWYDGGGILKPLTTRSVETELGPLMIVQFGLFRQLQP